MTNTSYASKDQYNDHTPTPKDNKRITNNELLCILEMNEFESSKKVDRRKSRSKSKSNSTSKRSRIRSYDDVG